MIRELKGDVQRHRKLTNPYVWPLLVHRLGRAADTLPGPLRSLGTRLYSIASFGLDMTLGTVLHRQIQIGEDLVLIHGSNIKIHPSAVLGDRVVLNHDVTLGVKHHKTEGVPRIGNDVFIGAGAKLLGPITVGDGAVIAANSLVVTDVPPGETVMGVPARPVPKRGTLPSQGPHASRSHVRIVQPPASGASK